MTGFRVADIESARLPQLDPFAVPFVAVWANGSWFCNGIVALRLAPGEVAAEWWAKRNPGESLHRSFCKLMTKVVGSTRCDLATFDPRVFSRVDASGQLWISRKVGCNYIDNRYASFFPSDCEWRGKERLQPVSAWIEGHLIAVLHVLSLSDDDVREYSPEALPMREGAAR